jgi:hypothetical protein
VVGVGVGVGVGGGTLMMTRYYLREITCIVKENLLQIACVFKGNCTFILGIYIYIYILCVCVCVCVCV